MENSLLFIFDEIPLTPFPLAWLNTETEKGFYIGTVEAVDLEKHQYWVTFDKPGKP